MYLVLIVIEFNYNKGIAIGGNIVAILLFFLTFFLI